MRKSLLKLKKTTFLLFLSSSIFHSFSQSAITDYRRSSLTMVLIENQGLGKNKQMVTNSYYQNPFPDKYNNHEIADKVFNPDALKLTTSDYLNAGFYKDTLKTAKQFLLAKKKPFNPIRYLGKDSSMAVQEPSKEELLNIYIQKYITEKKLAKQIVASWFERKSNGEMTMQLIKNRGKYSASAANLENNNKTFDPDAKYLDDHDLIANTYTVFNRMDFYANEPAARIVREAAKVEATKKFAGKPEALLKKALEGIDAVYEKTKEGYTVICNTYLYQLIWNDTISQKTRNIFFNNASNVDKVKAWDTISLYKMKFVGKTVSSSIVTFKIGEKRTEEQIIDLQVKRTMDNALAKLQKEYEQFRPIAPTEGVGPVTVKIGMKEGLEPGQKYEVLKYNEIDPLHPFLEKVDVVTVSKKNPIWDNRQGADQEPLLDKEGKPIVTPAYTTFDGGKKLKKDFVYYIRLIK